MTVGVTIDDGVAVISLDDGKMNAIGHGTIAAINGGLDRALADAAAVVIHGNDRALSAGFDLKVMQGGDPGAVGALVGSGGEMLLRLFRHPQPTVIAVTGHALAAGALLVLACDTRIGTPGSAKIGLNEVAIGLPLPDFAVELAVARLSKRFLTRAAVQAEIFDAEGAVAAGYLDRLEADCVAAAKTDARTLAELSAPAYGATKASLRRPGEDLR